MAHSHNIDEFRSNNLCTAPTIMLFVTFFWKEHIKSFKMAQTRPFYHY